MEERQIVISFESYSSYKEMSSEDRELCEAALDAQKGSYAPYSNFNVGAAVRLADGRIVKGSNQENAAYPSGLCAERTAMFAASAANPGVPMRSLAVVAGPDMTVCDEPAAPCGACRQVMAEYQHIAKAPISVILIGGKAVWKFAKVDDLLPVIFHNLDK